MILAALGAGSLVLIGSAVAIVVGSTLFGIGFGAAQNLTLTLMYNRVPKSRYGQVSALWNLAYDGGWGDGRHHLRRWWSPASDTRWPSV